MARHTSYTRIGIPATVIAMAAILIDSYALGAARAQEPPATASSPANVTIRGRVVGPKGEPVGHARIFFGGLDGQDVVVRQLTAPTDRDGRYACAVERGRYLISIAALPEKYTAPFVDRHERRDIQKDTDWGDFAVRAARSVDCIVVDESGKPVADAGVRVPMFGPQFFEGRDWNWTGLRTDADGRVTLRHLDDEDRYAIYVSAGERTSDGPVMITPSEVTGPVRIPISPANATRIVGRVVDPNGEGIAEAEITVFWTVLNTSRLSSLHSGSHLLTRINSDQKGAFACNGLWPGDRYRLSVQKRGYSNNDDAEQLVERGPGVEFPPIVLKKLGDALAGRVVDTDGKPVAGAKVFLTYSSPKAETDESGKFQIAESPTPSAMLLVQKDGYRLAAFAVGPDRKTDLVMRRTEAGPPPRPQAFPDDERIAIAREFLDALWARSWSPRQRPSSELVRAMARIDTAVATEWSAKCDGAHDAIVFQQRAENLLAAGEIQSAVSLLAAQKPATAMRSLSPVIDRFTPTDPEKALKIAEETLALIRGMDQLEATPRLAKLGRQLILLKRPDAGRKLIEEAAASLSKVGAAPMSAYYQREIAGGLAAIDVERAFSIVQSIRAENEKRFAPAYLVKIAARFDPERAIPLLERIDEVHQRQEAQSRIALELGQKDWNAGVQLAAKVAQVGNRSLAFGWLAAQRAKTDPVAAQALLRRALDDLIKNREDLTLYGSGGGGVFGAHLAVLAAQLDHPDLDVFIAAALGLRGGPRGGGRLDDWVSGSVKMFGMLGLTDPALGREALATLIPVLERMQERSLGRAEWLAAWAVVDPPLATEMVLEAIAKLTDERSDLFFSGVSALSALSTPPSQRIRGDFVLYMNAPIWFPDEDR